MKTYIVENEAGEREKVDQDKLSMAEKDGYYPVVKKDDDEQRVSFKDIPQAEKDGYAVMFEPSIAEEALALAGKGLGYAGKGVELAGDVISYVDAPLRETLAIPSKVANAEDLGDIGQAVVEPARQLLQKPSNAPTYTQIATMYGVPQNDLAIAGALTENDPRANQAMFEQYDQDQVQLSPEQKTQAVQQYMKEEPAMLSPASLVGAGLETVLGGKGLEAGAKALSKATKAISKIGDVATGTNYPSNVTEQLALTGKETVKEAGNIISEYFNPSKLNQKNVFSGENKNIVQEVFKGNVPSAIKYTPNSDIVRLERALADRKGGGELVRVHNEGIKKIWNYIQEIPSTILKKTSQGSPLEPIKAGQYLINSYNKAFEKVFKDVDFTRRSILSQFPLQKMPRLTKEAKKYIVDTVKEAKLDIKGFKVGKNNIVAQEISEIEEILKDVNSIKDIEDLHKKITSVGRLAYDSNSLINPVDQSKLKGIYRKLNDAFISEIEVTLGPNVSDNLIINNKEISSLLENTSEINDLLNKKSQRLLPPEKAFKMIIESGDSNQIEQLVKILPEEDLDVVRASYLNDRLFNKSDLSFAEDKTPQVKWNTVQNKLNNDVAFQMLFSDGEKKRILGALDLGSMMGTPYASTSGTGLSQSGIQSKASLIDRLVNVPELKRQKLFMDQLPPNQTVGQSSSPVRGLVLDGITKQNVADQFLSPYMTPQQIDQDPSLSPTQRAKIKNQIYKQPQQ